jgi:hypothetical protein
MDLPPKKNPENSFDELTYDEKSIRLFEMADLMLTERNVPPADPFSNNRYQILSLKPHELAEIAPIFESHLIDAPDSLKMAFGCDAAEEPDYEAQNVLMVTTKSAELEISYMMWYSPDRSDDPIDFTKDAVRVYPSPAPYTDEDSSFGCEALIHDTVYYRAPVEDYDMGMLRDVLVHLTVNSPKE